ncbi:MAG: thiamine phosphate synthase [Sulfurimonas sp.]|jgi:thiamine-phosphate pyrophosphorylase|nr:thiamine phosphate synthase [Sulfurimonas sp.]MBU3940054.1 thiamine phosphate synthase [bacterium]MBU4025259.1 thiamine phosphate synthase [bacterium]MBU4059831.1 thiamine phosphate synthase [bacterium]MBU4110377.1 thiamine phosphate synthase [bacterium]
MFKDKLQGLYVITDDVLTPPKTLMTQVEEALKGGAKIVQLRDKTSSHEDIKKTALALQKLCNSYNALFILNDAVELAIELGLSGLHIGKSDHHRVSEIRKKFKGVLGVSCYGDIELAIEMQGEGVDYVAFGSFFSSPTKPGSNIVPLGVLRIAKNSLDIPICAIGGLDSENISDVMLYEPDMVACISDIWKSENIEEKSAFYKNLYL